ncbi:MAG: helix-turn-helix domain-containing protein [Prevotellaceae bacterium]|nr:helix-turn-helix domain-containing protein [Prevotellaceae bacterium]
MGKYSELTAIKSLEQKALDMYQQGLSYSEIAKRLKVCKTTVYNWHRKVKAQIGE